jgi:predicted  nucleic acid-binding Zn-ribbon protein
MHCGGMRLLKPGCPECGLRNKERQEREARELEEFVKQQKANEQKNDD